METFWFTAQPESEMNIINLIGKAYIDHLTYPSTLTGGGVKEVARDDVLIDQLKNIDLQQFEWKNLLFFTNAEVMFRMENY